MYETLEDANQALTQIAALIPGCQKPEAADGWDLCGHADPWPCRQTLAHWLATGNDPAATLAEAVYIPAGAKLADISQRIDQEPGLGGPRPRARITAPGVRLGDALTTLGQHFLDDSDPDVVVTGLLAYAVAALTAVEHLTGGQGGSLALLLAQIDVEHATTESTCHGDCAREDTA